MAELGSVYYNGLIAGDFPTKVEEIFINGPADFKSGDVVGIKTDDGSFCLVDSTKTDGSQIPVGIICDDVIVDEGETAKSTMYVKGEFAQRFLNFGGTDTSLLHKRYMTQIGLLIKETKVEGGAY